MSKAITCGKFKELFKNCYDNTIMNFSFLMSFEEDCCLNCRYYFDYGGYSIEPVKNSKMKIGKICPLFSK